MALGLCISFRNLLTRRNIEKTPEDLLLAWPEFVTCPLHLCLILWAPLLLNVLLQRVHILG